MAIKVYLKIPMGAVLDIEGTLEEIEKAMVETRPRGIRASSALEDHSRKFIIPLDNISYISNK